MLKDDEEIDNQKLNGYLGPYRFLRFLAKPPGDPAVLAFLKGRIDNSLGILDKRLASRSFVLGERPTIADLSLVAYLYYPTDEFGFDSMTSPLYTGLARSFQHLGTGNFLFAMISVL